MANRVFKRIEKTFANINQNNTEVVILVAK